MGQKALKYQLFHIRACMFWPSFSHMLAYRAEFFMLTIIYRSVLKNPGFGPYLSFSIFCAPCWGLKKGVAPQIPIWVWDLRTKPKSWPTWWTFFCHLLSHNCVSNETYNFATKFYCKIILFILSQYREFLRLTIAICLQ